MTRIQKIITDGRKLREAEIVPACEFIVESMETNPSFTEPTPKITVFKALVASYAAALTDAASRDRNKVALKKQLRKDLNASYSQLGNYVNTISNGNVPMLISSGFTMAKQPQPRYVAAPGSVTLKQGINSGTLVCKVKADKAATGYIHFITPAPLTADSEWVSFTTSRSQYEFMNLEARKEYVIKVAVVGSKDQVAYSATTNFFVL